MDNYDLPELRNPYAEVGHADSGDIIKPEDAQPHVKYYCSEANCTDPERILHLRKLKKGRDHFYHLGDHDHEQNGETLLHKLAIGYFKDLKSFELPKLNGAPSGARLSTRALYTTIRY